MYYDLTNSKTLESVRNTLTEDYWISEDVLNFTFDVYGRNEETLENICYYYDINLNELLNKAWIEDEDEDEDEEEDED